MTSILLTRAESINHALSKHSLFSDHQVVSRPLMEARSVELDNAGRSTILSLDEFDKIVFISKNAVIFGLPQLENFWPQWPASLQWLTVGSATASELKRYDIDAVYPKQASSEGLLAHSALQDVEGQRCLIVRGIGGRETLRLGLEARLARVNYLEVYERVVIPYQPDAFPNQAIALVYSGEAVQHLYDSVGKNVRQYHLILPSERLIEVANGLGFGKVSLAKSQEDRAMLEILEKTLEQ